MSTSVPFVIARLKRFDAKEALTSILYSTHQFAPIKLNLSKRLPELNNKCLNIFLRIILFRKIEYDQRPSSL